MTLKLTGGWRLQEHEEWYIANKDTKYFKEKNQKQPVTGA